MSHIPNSAMPHAGPSHQPQQEETATSSRREKIADKARSNPKTAIAAGAVVAAGVIAAAAIPLVRARKKNASEGETKTKGTRQTDSAAS